MHPTRISTDEVSGVATPDRIFPLTDLYQALPGLVGASARSPRDTVQLSDEQMLLVSSLLYGYSLQDGMWGKSRLQRPQMLRLMADTAPFTQVHLPWIESRTSCGTSNSTLHRN